MPILLSTEEWDRIVKSTDADREDPDAARLRKYLTFLNEKSAEMTKTWPNSLENVNKRNEEVRRARTEASEKANSRFYKRYVRRKKEEQDRMMHSARDTIFKNKDAPKLLLSAVVESVILKEREEQIKFDHEYVGAHRREQNRLFDEMISRKAREWNQLQDEKRRRRFAVNKQHQQDLLDQIKEIEDRKHREMEEELKQQRQDIMNSKMEMEAIKQLEEEFKEASKKRIWEDNERSRVETEQRKTEARRRDHMDDQLLEVLARSQCKIEDKRKAVEKELRAEKLRILDKISKNVQNTTGERDAKEQASLDNAVRERDAAVEARHQAMLAKKERFKRDRMETREKFLRDEAQRLHEHHTQQQWGLMNRFKNQEIYEDYKDNIRKEKERKTKEYREELLKLRHECATRNDQENAERRNFYGKYAEEKVRQADNKLLTHAAALIEEAQRNGRPTLPIYKAMDRYCKMYRLYPMPDLPASLQEHFGGYAPRDGSAPDPAYREPRAPPPQDDPDAFYLQEGDGDGDGDGDGGEEGEKRDGLQALVKAKETKPSPKATTSPKLPKASPKPESKDDYKRQGRANGLQRKPEPREEIVLPPITVVTYPCKKLGIVSDVPLRRQHCDCVMVGEI